MNDYDDYRQVTENYKRDLKQEVLVDLDIESDYEDDEDDDSCPACERYNCSGMCCI